MKLLSHAMDYWSNGLQKAIFLNHEVIYRYIESITLVINIIINSLVQIVSNQLLNISLKLQETQKYWKVKFSKF